MNTFLELLEGTFSNKRQAQGHPTRYAHIWVKHCHVRDNLFYGEQAYNYKRDRPYRQFVIKVIEEDGQYRLKNYQIDRPERFVGGTNLEELTEADLTYRISCDIIMKPDGDGFKGSADTCECWVEWRGVKTYVANEIYLSETEYQVVDRGLDAKTNERVWGSEWGAFQFKRMT